MKDSTSEDIPKIFNDVLTARNALLDNHINLNKVADYCENILKNANDTSKAVEESKALTTQALASVAYQINSLARSVLRLLDAQTVQLKQMESSVNLLGMTVDIYKEKVARHEIGVLTVPCKIPCVLKMVPPERTEECIIEYERNPISYTSLDLIGHGVWDGTKTGAKKQPETQSTIQQPTIPETGHHFGSTAGIAVAPPSVPNWPGFKSTATPSVSSSFTTDPEIPPPPTPSNTAVPPAPPPPQPSSPFPTITPISASTALPSPFSPAFRNSFLPPPPSPQTEFMSSVLPTPPSSPPPPPQETLMSPPPPPPPSFEVLYAPSPLNAQCSFMAPPPSPCHGKVHVAPPPPPRSTTGVGGVLPPPPTPGQGNFVPPPPPPPTPGQGQFVPPPPPPSGQGLFVPPPPPPPPPPGQGKFQIPLPPPPPPF